MQEVVLLQSLNTPKTGGLNAYKTKSDEKPENIWWSIYEYLDNLRSSIQDKANKIGDNLIQEQLENEEKRLRKIEVESQQRALQEAKNYEKLII